MSYQEQVISVKETVLEYKYIVVATGTATPTPATGYQIQPVFSDMNGMDVYLEYKTFERDHV